MSDDEDLDREYDQLDTLSWAARLSAVERVIKRHGLDEAVCFAVEAAGADLLLQPPTWTSQEWAVRARLQDVASQDIIFRATGRHPACEATAQKDVHSQVLNFATCLIGAKIASALGPSPHSVGLDYKHLQPHLVKRLQELQEIAQREVISTATPSEL